MPARSGRSLLLTLAAVFVVAAPAHAATWVATLDPTPDYSIQITIDDTGDDIEFVLAGPSDRWFALGLGQSNMSGSYAMVASGAPHVMVERMLGSFNPGVELPSSLSVSSSLDVDTITFTMNRVLDPGTGAYVFNLTDVSQGVPIPVIWAVGQSTTFSYHGPTRGGTTTTFGPDATSVAEGIDHVSFGALKAIFRRVDSGE